MRAGRTELSEKLLMVLMVLAEAKTRPGWSSEREDALGYISPPRTPTWQEWEKIK